MATNNAIPATNGEVSEPLNFLKTNIRIYAGKIPNFFVLLQEKDDFILILFAGNKATIQFGYLLASN